MIHPLQSRTYYQLLFAQIFSLVGTGVCTIALSLLAYEIAGKHAGLVLGIALALKITAYIAMAPLAGRLAQKLPRRTWLASLDVIRAAIVLALPLITHVWQIYVLIFLLGLTSAAYTPTYQSLLSSILIDDNSYLKALNISRIALDIEQLLSPVLACLLLGLISYEHLFSLNALTFALAGFSVLTIKPLQLACTLNPKAKTHSFFTGVKIYLQSPRLRALWCAYFAVASASSMLLVNTVVYVHQYLGRTDQDTALAIAAAGLGSMSIAVIFPRLLRQLDSKVLVYTGSVLITLSLLGAGIAVPNWHGFLIICLVLGIGMSLIQTPASAQIRRVCQEGDASQFFSAHIVLTHGCWLIAYLAAGLSSTYWGMVPSYAMMAGIAAAGTIFCIMWLPTEDNHLHWTQGGQQAGGELPYLGEKRSID